jgi:hypothetical protein
MSNWRVIHPLKRETLFQIKENFDSIGGVFTRWVTFEKEINPYYSKG